MMQDWNALLLVSGLLGLDIIFIVLAMKFKRAVLPVAGQETNVSVISKDCRIVWVLIISKKSLVVTCFNAANHKQVMMMMAGRIALFKMRHN
jgi:hypothetical protein